MNLVRNAPPKPLRGEHLLERREERRRRVAAEQKTMQAALVRDKRRCRFPRCAFAKRDLPIDPAHLTHRGSGGNPKGDRTTRDQVIALCRLHHGMFDRCQIAIDPVTPQGTDGPCAFLQQDPETGQMVVVAIESRLGVSETRR